MRGAASLLWAVILSAVAAATAAGQSLTAGAISGLVQDSNDVPVAQANVTLTDRATGSTRTVQTGRDGRFSFPLLAPSRYDMFVEQLGFEPKVVAGLSVYAGSSAGVTVTLAAATPPVTTIDTVAYRGGLQPSGYMAGGLPLPLDLADLLDDRRLLSSVAGLSSSASAALEMEGLPPRLAGLVLDGVARTSAQHPEIAGSSLEGIAFPLAAFGQAARPSGAADVEWSGLNGGFLSAQSLRGARSLQPKVYGDWSAEGPRGGVLLSGPVVADTAAFVAGLEAAQLDRSLPAPWVRDTLTSLIVATAKDSSATDLGGYLRAHHVKTQLVSGFVRLDWQIAPSYALAVRGSVASATVNDPGLGPALAPSLGFSLRARDVSAEAWLTSRVSEKAGLELRFSLDGSTRDYGAPALAGTTIVDGGLSLGAGDALPGRFQRTDVRVSGTGHLAAGAHQLKLGLGLGFISHDQTYAAGTAGQFVFAGATEFARHLGVFSQTVGPLPVASFQMPQAAVYAQDLWTPAPGLELLLGLRYDVEQWPVSSVVLNQAWQNSTGLSNDSLPKKSGQLSPRFSFRWSAGEARLWALYGSAGLFFGGADPALMGEAITHAGATEVRRGIGSLGAWPTAPDSTVAPVTGAALTLLGPQFVPPRTGRATLGVNRSLSASTTLDISGTYRHTDFLPRRADLNLPVASSATDQYGRAIYGTLVQQGSLLAASAGSNRRFSGFDLVSAINPDGFSDYWGATVTLERTALRGLNLLASYTYSRTKDNWLGAGGGGPEAQLSPFPRGLNGGDWADGRSDFDVPHRVLAGAELAFPGSVGLRLGVLYQYRSGSPFTPGFRDGVDANGDGSASNDPAFVDNKIKGMDALVAKWSCLQTQIGRFAERNSCRTEAVQSLSARLAIGLFRVGDSRTELVVDGLNLIQSDVGIVDRALFLVDRSGTLATNPQTGVVTVPLVANPNFGKLLVKQTDAQIWRVGLRVNY